MSKKKSRPQQAATSSHTHSQPKVSSKPTIATGTRSYWFVALLCVLPFIFSRATLDPAVAPRYLLLTIFMAVYVLGFYLLQKQEVQLPGITKWVFLTGLVFFIWNIICLAGALNKAAGYFEINRLLVNLVLLLIIADLFAKDSHAMNRISKVIAIVGIVHALVVVMQYYGWAFANLPGANALPYGLMANRNLMGSAQTFLLPFELYLLYRSAGSWKALAGISLFMTLVSIVLSQTRSAWLSTVVLLIVSLVLVFIFIRSMRKKWLITTLVVLGAGILTGVFLTVIDKEGTLSAELKNRSVSFVNAAADTGISKKSANDRIVLWKKTMEMSKTHLLTGVGPSNWNLSISTYGTSELSWNDSFYIPDRVHNVYLQMAAELGLPGLLLFLAFWICIIVAGWQAIRMATNDDDKMTIIILMSGLAAFASDCMLSFPQERIEHMLYVMLMAGGMLGYYTSMMKREGRAGKALPRWIFMIALLVAISGIFMGCQRYQFEKNLHQVKAAELDKSPQDMLAYAQKGKQPFIKLDLEGMSLELKEAMAYAYLKDFPKAIAAMKQALVLSPHHPQALNNMGTYYTETGDFKNAIPYYEKALKLAPGLTLIKMNLALNYYNVGRYRECVQLLNTFNYQQEPVFIDVMKQSQQILKDSSGVK